MSYIKPQTPLQHKDGDYFYPLTTIDQVIMEDGITRLNGADLVSVNTDGAPEGETVKVNADTLGGYSADNFIKNTEEINADTLGGISADEFAKLSDLENLNTSGISMELLWENASPTSNFDAQTITIPGLNIYDGVKIVIAFSVYGYSEINEMRETILYKPFTNTACFIFITNEKTIYCCSRNITIDYTNEEIIFGEGRLRYAADQSHNGRAIPLQIYGIKGVSA